MACNPCAGLGLHEALFPQWYLRALRMGDTVDVRRTFSRVDIATWAKLAQMPELPGHIPEPLIADLYSCFLGEPLCAQVRITRLRADKALVNLDTQCHSEDGRLLCSTPYIATARAIGRKVYYWQLQTYSISTAFWCCPIFTPHSTA